MRHLKLQLWKSGFNGEKGGRSIKGGEGGPMGNRLSIESRIPTAADETYDSKAYPSVRIYCVSAFSVPAAGELLYRQLI